MGGPTQPTAAATGFSVAPPERWITGSATPPPEAPARPGDARQLLLIDHQLFPERRSRYLRKVQRVGDDRAAQALRDIALDFDPAIETLCVHSVRVWRDGGAVEHADRNRFKLVEREGDAERRDDDARLTALLSIDDLRAGDLVDVACSWRIVHADLADHFSAVVEVRLPVPVARWSLSSIERDDSGLRWQAEGDVPSEKLRPLKDGWQLRHWSAADVPAAKVESNTPGWHSDVPRLQCSDFESWAEFAAWTAGHWGKPSPPQSLRELAAKIAAACDDEIGRADRALSFVRDEIRCLAPAGSPGAHREAAGAPCPGLRSPAPRPLEEILRSRSGDCRDKSQLLCTLLRLLKIPASPVLVHSVAGRFVEVPLPSPEAFDHVIVGAKIAGAMKWMDPARSGAAVSVRSFTPACLRRGLLVSAKAAKLVKIPATPPDASLLVVKEHFFIRRPDEPAELAVCLEASGVEAEQLRNALATLGMTGYREARESQLREFYPGLRADGNWQSATPDGGHNLVLSERYLIEDFTPGREQGERCVKLVASTIRLRFPGSPEAGRRAPWALPYPCRIRHEIRVDLPVELPHGSGGHEVISDAFGFRSKVSARGGFLEAIYRYWSKSDHVPPAEMEAFRADAAQMQKRLTHVQGIPGSGNAWREPTPARAGGDSAKRARLVQKHVRATLRERHSRFLLLVGTLAAVGVIWFAMTPQDELRAPPPPRDEPIPVLELQPRDDGADPLAGPGRFAGEPASSGEFAIPTGDGLAIPEDEGQPATPLEPGIGLPDPAEGFKTPSLLEDQGTLPGFDPDKEIEPEDVDFSIKL